MKGLSFPTIIATTVSMIIANLIVKKLNLY